MKKMKEEFMYYLWRSGKLFQKDLRTTDDLPISVIKPGYRNSSEGPDFLDARIRIGEVIWSGQVEFHIKSSDWDLHRHQYDSNYNNVVLHVVMEDDKSVFTQKKVELPTLELRYHTDEIQLRKYYLLQQQRGWIPCDPLMKYYRDDFIWPVYLSGLGVERMTEKSGRILRLVNKTKGDWEYVALRIFARYLIGSRNATAVEEMLQRTPSSVIRKYKSDLPKLEALFFGQSGFLPDPEDADPYCRNLIRNYSHLKKLHSLRPINRSHWKFMGTRPASYPTLRISQLCHLINRFPGMTSLLLAARTTEELKKELYSIASPYWNEHYTFGRPSKVSAPKITGPSQLNKLILNAAAPLVFAYGCYTANQELRERALEWWEQLPPERNQILDKWSDRGLNPKNALESQGLLQLRNNYCSASACLDCSFGNKILNKNTMDNKVCEEVLNYVKAPDLQLSI